MELIKKKVNKGTEICYSSRLVSLVYYLKNNFLEIFFKIFPQLCEIDQLYPVMFWNKNATAVTSGDYKCPLKSTTHILNDMTIQVVLIPPPKHCLTTYRSPEASTLTLPKMTLNCHTQISSATVNTYDVT